ncbi:MAG: hypothetical protein ABL983_01245, partial [Nitrospira sp.]
VGAHLFQSSPAPKDGRYKTGPGTTTGSIRFQSSPAPKDGRYCTTSPRPEITYFSHGFRERIKQSLRCTNFTIARFIQVIEK